MCFAVCTSALALVPNDALRVVWLFINVPCVYILLGQRAGAFVTTCSILLLALGNPYFVAPYTGTELVGGIMGLGLLAFLFHICRARSHYRSTGGCKSPKSGCATWSPPMH
ncbi:MAG: hypothetical protein ACK40S_09975 [Burkholderiaceae bacterium]